MTASRNRAASLTPSHVAAAAVVLVGSWAGASTASAQFPHAPWGGWGGIGPSAVISNADRIPYFAAHPPVYYSQAVPRPYGYSPYPLLPGQHPAEPVVVPHTTAKPKVIVNPYVPSAVERAVPRPTASDQGEAAGSSVSDRSA